MLVIGRLEISEWQTREGETRVSYDVWADYVVNVSPRYEDANGVEGHRQKTPGNAVEIAKALLGAGAEVDALADMYGGHYATMSMLVSSCHPAKAGVQVALVDTLDYFPTNHPARVSP